MNRGKRSITVDLKHAEGAELVRRLAAICDVVLTNYRIGVLDRLGYFTAPQETARRDRSRCF